MITDPNEMAEIYRRNKLSVYRTAYSWCRNTQDAEDVTQDVFLARFASDRAFPTPDDEKAWLIRVTINRCKDLLKSFRRTRTESLDLVGERAAPAQQSEVMQAIDQLPDMYRIIVCLHYIEGYSLREIGQLTDSPESTVQTRIQRARKRLKKLLKEDF